MEPSGTMKASQHGRNFQLSSHLISLYPTTKVCGIFSNVVLIVVGRNQQQWAIASIVSRASVIHFLLMIYAGAEPEQYKLSLSSL